MEITMEIKKMGEQIIAQLNDIQKDNTKKMNGLDEKVKSLDTAVRLMQEASTKIGYEVTSTDDNLKKFVNPDGSIRLSRGKVEGGLVEDGLLDTTENMSQWHIDLKKLAEQKSLLGKMLIKGVTPKTDAMIKRHLSLAPRSIRSAVEKSMYDGAGVGAELVPDQFLAMLHEQYQLPKVVRSLFGQIEMTSASMLVPRLDRGGRPYIKGQVTVDNPAYYTASTPVTAQKTINAKGLATHYVLDEDLTEDSAILLLPAMQKQIAQDLADAFEDAIINGDSAGTHQDTIANWNIRGRWGSSGLGTSADHRKLFTGLRAQAFDRSSTKDISSLTITKFLEMVAVAGEFATASRVLIASPEAITQHVLGLDQLITVDKFGPNATILSGQIGSIFGIPVVMSRFLSADMNASGIFDNVTTTKTGLLLANTDSWNVFARRGVQVEQEKDIKTGAYHLVATERVTFDTMDSDSAKNVVFGYNL